MVIRIISGAILAAIAFAAFWLGGTVFSAFLILFAGICLFEFTQGMKKAGKRPMYSVFGVLYLLMVLMLFSNRNTPGILTVKILPTMNLVPPVLVFTLFLAMAISVLGHKKFTLDDAVYSFFGAFYIIFLASYAIFIRNRHAGGGYFLTLIIWGSVCSDTAAYFIGSKFGKRKLCPDISPKKSVEGSIAAFAGSIIGCIAFGVLLMFMNKLTAVPLYMYALLGIALGFTAQIGDLFASLVKRKFEIKDFGNIIPGHGGILDRIDSYMPSVFVGYYFVVVVTRLFLK